jgi:hypothetical protein
MKTLTKNIFPRLIYLIPDRNKSEKAEKETVLLGSSENMQKFVSFK